MVNYPCFTTIFGISLLFFPCRSNQFWSKSYSSWIDRKVLYAYVHTLRSFNGDYSWDPLQAAASRLRKLAEFWCFFWFWGEQGGWTNAGSTCCDGFTKSNKNRRKFSRLVDIFGMASGKNTLKKGGYIPPNKKNWHGTWKTPPLKRKTIFQTFIFVLKIVVCQEGKDLKKNVGIDGLGAPLCCT